MPEISCELRFNVHKSTVKHFHIPIFVVEVPRRGDSIVIKINEDDEEDLVLEALSAVHIAGLNKEDWRSVIIPTKPIPINENKLEEIVESLKEKYNPRWISVIKNVYPVITKSQESQD